MSNVRPYANGALALACALLLPAVVGRGQSEPIELTPQSGKTDYTLAQTAAFGGDVAARGTIATMSLKAIDINGTPVAGDQQHIVAQRGDQITVEILARDWATELPSGVRSYQARVRGRIAAVSGSNGTVLPLGWDAAPAPDFCITSDDCSGSLICRSGLCVEPTHDPRLGAEIDTSRSDFILTGFDVTKGIQTVTLDYTYFSVGSDAVGQVDPGFEMYCGTLILVVSDFACGTFTFMLNAQETFLVDPTFLVVNPILESLIIDIDTGIPGLGVTECPPLPTSTDPPNCAIDARIPHSPNEATAELGIQTIDMAFDSDPSSHTTSDFAVSVLPFALPPSITALTHIGGNTLRITLSNIIDANRYTCVRHNLSDRLFCWGNLPGDVSNNAVADSDDTALLLEALSGLVVLPNGAGDINRSGEIEPADLLELNALMEGCGAYDVWRGQVIDASCPSK